MKIYVSRLGAQYFLVLEDLFCLPINKITEIDLHYNDNSANCVVIKLEDRHYHFNFEQADSIREFLQNNEIKVPLK